MMILCCVLGNCLNFGMYNLNLMKQVIPAPPRCICGRRVYSYTYNKVENEREHYWEVFARCVNRDCRYMRRYLPDTTYKWSRPASIIRELAKIPTFYEMDGQQVEESWCLRKL